MGPNRQSKRKPDDGGTGGGTGRGGGGRGGGRGGHHHSRRGGFAPAGSGTTGTAVGLHAAHKDMLVDVLRHVASSGKTHVSDAHFDHRKNTITFTRNRALTILECAQVVFERMGFDGAAVSAYISACESQSREAEGPDCSEGLWLPDGANTVAALELFAEFLDSVGLDLFLTLVGMKRQAAGTADAAETPDDEAAWKEQREAEVEMVRAIFGDVMLPEDEDNGGASATTGGDGATEDDREDNYDDLELRLPTADEVPVIVYVRLYDDYPRQCPAVLLPMGPEAVPLTPQTRKVVLDAAAESIASVSPGEGCLVQLVGALKEAVGDQLTAPKEEERIAAEAKRKAELEKAKLKDNKLDADAATVSREAFLQSLVTQDKAARTTEQAAATPALSSGAPKVNTRDPKQRTAGGGAAGAAAAAKPKTAASSGGGVLSTSKDMVTREDGTMQAATETVVMPKPVAAKTVDTEALRNEFIRTTVREPSQKVDQSLAEEWATLRKSGSLMKVRNNLPAVQIRAQLKSLLLEKKNRVIVVGGDTGSGKTTQVPQFVYEFFCEEGKGSLCNIVCTQPRRLAATAVALRVADERDSTIGESVGYSIRLENRIGPRTRLLYCTTGILLRRLQSDPNIGNISHVIVDEIHERGVDTDFLLILLRDLLRRRHDLTVVLMSATMNAAKFSDYFGGAPVITIPGRTHPVTVVPLEKIIPNIGYILEEGSRYGKLEGVGPRSNAGSKMRNARLTEAQAGRMEADEDRSMAAEADRAARLAQGNTGEPIDAATAETLARMDPDKINYELVDRLVEYIDRTNKNDDGAVLIFMPGMAEITKCCDELRGNPRLSQRCVIFNLHSSLGNADQKAVFGRPPRGKRKVVVGTNIMETSITIDDAVYVIDCGRFKENRYDPRKSLSQLVTCWVSKAAARQRTGRAGRVRPGQCYRLYTTGAFERLDDSQLCEMQRVPLESLILQIHVLNLGDEMAFLRKAMDPPVERAVQGSVSVLTSLGALSAEDKKLTSLGYHLANLPLDVRIGKMIIIGAVLRCLDPVLTIAACLSVRSPFQASTNDAPQVDLIRRQFSRDYNSDLLSNHFAYSGWLKAHHKGGEAHARAFCREAFLSTSALQQIQSTKTQYERYLVEAGFMELRRANPEEKNDAAGSGDGRKGGSRKGGFLSRKYVTMDDTVYETGGWHYNGNSDVVKCIVAALVAGLYPNVARILPRQPTKAGASAPPGRAPFVKASTRDGSDVVIHPSSVNAAASKSFTHPFVCYVEKVKTSATFVRDTSMVSPYALLLFGGRSTYLPQYGELVFDDWVSFGASEDAAVLLMRLKEQLDSALMAKINDPTVGWESSAGNVVRAMERLLKDEGARSLVVIDRRDRRTRYSDPNAGNGTTNPLPKRSLEERRAERIASRRRLVTCFNCGEKGHLARDCANRPHGIGPTEPCFVCGARAHYATACPVLVPPARSGAAAADDEEEDEALDER